MKKSAAIKKIRNRAKLVDRKVVRSRDIDHHGNGSDLRFMPDLRALTRQFPFGSIAMIPSALLTFAVTAMRAIQ